MSTIDEPITNMEELLQKHAREREQDLGLIPPLSLQARLEGNMERVPSEPNGLDPRVTDSSTSLQALVEASSNNNIKINITEEPVTIPIINIVSDPIYPVITPSRIENARGNVTLPLESPPEVGDLNRQRCKTSSELKKYVSFQEEDPLPNSSGLCSNEDTFLRAPSVLKGCDPPGVNDRVSSSVSVCSTQPYPEFTYQIPEHVLLEQKVLKLEQEMVVLKRLIFEIYKKMSICPLQTLLLDNTHTENS